MEKNTKTKVENESKKLQKIDACKNDGRTIKTDPIYTTNPTAFPIGGLSINHDFVSEDEMQSIIDLLDNNNNISCEGENQKGWAYSGFPKRRKQRIFFEPHEASKTETGIATETFEQKLDWLFHRVHQTLSKLSVHKDGNEVLYKRPNLVFVEEYRGASPSGANVFEPNIDASYSDDHNGCYVAELTIGNHTLQSFRKPLERSNDCWDLFPDKDTKILVPKNSLLIKTGESLADWRNNNSIALQHWKEKTDTNGASDTKDANEDQDHYLKGMDLPDGMGKLTRGKDYRCISLKMRYSMVPVTDTETKPLTSSISSSQLYADQKNKPLSDLLTIIVTTSPIKSNPSTEVLEKAFDTFELAGYDFAYKCPKIIMCDGLRLQEEEGTGGDIDNNKKKPSKVTKKHNNAKQALRNGIANQTQAENYRLFKLALRKLCEDADKEAAANAKMCIDENERKKLSPFCNTKVVELQERHGYGFALREAVQKVHVKTPYVCVIQHDRTFMRQTPIMEVVQCMMSHHELVKYVGISMRSNLLFRDLFLGKYGKASYEEMEQMVIRSPELNLSTEVYGKNGSSVQGMLASVSDNIRENISALQSTYFTCQQGLAYLNWCKENNENDCSKQQFTLTPTLFWYDNIHIVETEHYRDFVFNPKYKMVARGGFVEDKLSPVLVRSVERRGLVEGHRRFGCYILDDHSGMFFTGHLDGGSYLTAEEKEAMKKKQLQKQQEKSSRQQKNGTI